MSHERNLTVDITAVVHERGGRVGAVTLIGANVEELDRWGASIDMWADEQMVVWLTKSEAWASTTTGTGRWCRYRREAGP